MGKVMSKVTVETELDLANLNSANLGDSNVEENHFEGKRFEGLPDPRDVGFGTDSFQKEIVIFDGQCNFCQRQVRNLKWFDRGSRLTFVSLHDPFVNQHIPDLSFDQMMEQMYVVSVDGSRRGGAEAIRYLSRKLPLLWFGAPFLHIPFSLPIWQSAYRFIASRRYKLAGKAEDCGESCKIHLK